MLAASITSSTDSATTGAPGASTFTAVGKWSRDHKCPEAIQLHVLQELWEICNGEECEDSPVCEDDAPEEAQVCLAISMSASTAVDSVHSIQF